MYSGKNVLSIMQIFFSFRWSTEMFELYKSFCQLYLQDLPEKNIKNHKMKFCKKRHVLVDYPNEYIESYRLKGIEIKKTLHILKLTQNI